MRQIPAAPLSTRPFHRAAREAIRESMDELGITPAPGNSSGGFEEKEAPPTGRKMTLIDAGDGSLEWRDAHEAPPPGAPRPAMGEMASGPTTLVEVPNEILDVNEIVARLQDYDARLTPDQGLRRWSSIGRRFEAIPAVPPLRDPVGRPGGILLVLHGTFSNGDAIFDQLASVERESQFLAWAEGHYEHILAFDHATLSVSPVLNGLDLARLFADVRGPVDVIAHSRGGLVARWWLEAFGGAAVGPRRAVFVASPLSGTSLASPAKLRDAFDMFTTVGAHLKAAGAAASVFLPFTTVAVVLLQVFQVATGSLARTPLADLFFAAVPGLGGMSRVGNSGELDRLQGRGGSSGLPDYFAVRSDFRMESAGWRFWKNFDRPGLRASHWGASRIFDQANDLAVDNRSTTEIFKGRGLPPERIKHFAGNGVVHHTNYFTQKEVADALRLFLA